MKNLFHSLLIFTLLISHLFTNAQDLPPNTTWKGEVMGIPLALNVSRDSMSQKFSATFDSPTQGAIGLPISKITVTTDSLKAYLASIKGGFYGQFNSDKSEINGTWQQGGGTFPMVFKRAEVAAPLHRPQTPKPPFPYQEEDVFYSNADQSINFGATLTFPQSDRPLPAVILITGSGSQDRNETLFGHQPFWVIADHLSRNGIAVLRVDDRGIGETTGDGMNATSADFALDVLAGVQYLKNRKEIDPKQIGLIGHSEGGVIAPLAAMKSPDIAFIVSMAGVGVKGSELMKKQLETSYAIMGYTASEIDIFNDLTDLFLRLNTDYPDQEELKEAFEPAFRAWRDQQPEEVMIKGKLAGEGSDELIRQMAGRMFNPWMRYFLKYDPAATLAKVKIPVLAINGEKDVQVDAEQNLAGFEKLLKQAGNSDYKIVSFPNLNHLFQTAKTGSVAEYAEIEETIAPEVLKVMTEWIKAHVK